MNVLITGGLGFTGRHIAKAVKDNAEAVLYLSDRIGDVEVDNYAECNLVDADNVNSLIQAVRPDRIYHLVGTFTNDFDEDYANNVLTSRHILEAVQNSGRACRVLLIGSAAEYGLVEADENPVEETRLLRPATIYGLTKVYQTYLMQYYCCTHQLDIVMARPFNIYGRGISKALFAGRVYQQIDQFKKGQIKKIQVGNLDNERDYISIEEVVTHYLKIMEYGKAGEIYNVGRGLPVRTEAILEEILNRENLDMSVVEVSETKRSQVYDVPRIYADITKLKQLN